MLNAKIIHLGKPIGLLRIDLSFKDLADHSLIGKSLEEWERTAILSTLGACHGHRANAAEMLDISETNLYRKLRQYRKQGFIQ